MCLCVGLPHGGESYLSPRMRAVVALAGRAGREVRVEKERDQDGWIRRWAMGRGEGFLALDP